MRIAFLLPVPPRSALRGAPVPPPRAAASLAGWLRQSGHDVSMIDAREPDPAGGVAASRPDLVLLPASARTGPEVAALARACKAACDAPTAAFGPLPSLFPAHVLGEPALDFAVVGDPEETVLQLLEQLPAPAAVDGLATRGVDGVVLGRPRRPFPDLDSLAPAAWELVDRSRYGLPRWAGKGDVLPVQLSRGCSHAECTFCASAGALKARYRRPDPEQAAARVVALAESLRPDALHFVDEEFVVGRDWVLDFTSALRRAGRPVPWSCEARPSQLDAGLLDRMKEGGCRQVVMGLEVLDSGLLRGFEKDQQVASCAEAARAASHADVATLGLLLVGMPGATPDIDRQSLEHALASNLDEIVLSPYCPTPGTPAWVKAGWGPEQLVADARCSGASWAPEGYADPAAVDAQIARLRRRWRTAPRRLDRLSRRLLRTPRLAARVTRTALLGPGPYLGVPGIDQP